MPRIMQKFLVLSEKSLRSPALINRVYSSRHLACFVGAIVEESLPLSPVISMGKDFLLLVLLLVLFLLLQERSDGVALNIHCLLC